MTRIIHLYESPDRFIVGTVGEPGERTFFFQAKENRRLISVVVEKSQVIALVERVGFLLREIKREHPNVLATKAMVDESPLENPIMEEFTVGIIGLIWLGDIEMISMEFQASDDSATAQDSDEIAILSESQEGPDLLKVVISPAQAEAFCLRAMRLVDAGRQPCTFCGLPLDLRGHVCPRANGYRR